MKIITRFEIEKSHDSIPREPFNSLRSVLIPYSRHLQFKFKLRVTLIPSGTVFKGIIRLPQKKWNLFQSSLP